MMRRRIVRKGTRDDLGTITLSIGAACYRPGEALTEIVRRADAALYFAKHHGRNRAACETDVETQPAGGAG
jgi:diguanylate cyclase